MADTFKSKQVFEEILKEFREDISHIWQLYNLLFEKSRGFDILSSEQREWVYDIFLDKIYETHAKFKRFLNRVNISSNTMDNALNRLVSTSEEVAFYEDLWISGRLYSLDTALKEYQRSMEETMTFVRRMFHEENWQKAGKLQAADYVVERRKKFVMARDELEKAKQSVENRIWDDVMNHLRGAIDLAIKEKFGFSRIHPMKAFFEDADKYDFPLPSYALIYNLFDEGSGRIHDGRIHTPFEAKEALKFVAHFIDQLDLIEIKRSQIEDFKKRCRAVE